MTVESTLVSGATVLTVSGRIDSGSAPLLEEHVLRATTPGCKLVLDLSAVDFMSSAGLRILLLTHRKITACDGRVVLVGLSDDLRGTLSATGFLKFLSIAPTLDAGLAAL